MTGLLRNARLRRSPLGNQSVEFRWAETRKKSHAVADGRAATIPLGQALDHGIPLRLGSSVGECRIRVLPRSRGTSRDAGPTSSLDLAPSLDEGGEETATPGAFRWPTRTAGSGRAAPFF